MEKAEEESRDVETIPHEVFFFNILTRLPVKSLSRFRSVSTLWNSTFSDPSFVHSHVSRSLTRPNGLMFLLTFPNQFNTERFIFSITIPANQNQSLHPIHLLTIPGFVRPYVSQSLQGLLCLDAGSQTCSIICNPSTRDFKTLPPTNPETPRSSLFNHYVSNSFGFDPVSNQHKVLNTWIIRVGHAENEMIMEHRVFTVGSDEWRRINIVAPYFPLNEGVCINGFIYRMGLISAIDLKSLVVVAFDVGGEEFRFIKLPSDGYDLGVNCVLREFEGHLALIDYQGLRNGNNLECWVLEDEEKQDWVKKSILFAANWTEINKDWKFYLAGTTYTGELIFAPHRLAKPFYVVFYDMKKNSVRRVEICGLPEYDFQFHDSYLNIRVMDHVESILSLA